jgi:hypothetical protein
MVSYWRSFSAPELAAPARSRSRPPCYAGLVAWPVWRARLPVSSRHSPACSLTGVEIHPRDVFRPLIRQATAAVIFCHNHPSGDPAPSRADMELTARLREVGDLCGIPVLDHVIVGWEGYTSLAERNWR